jgi:hypothetical protein
MPDSQYAQPPPKLGFSAQHINLAMALSIVWEDYLRFKADVEKEGLVDLESTDVSNRRLTVVLLSAALCEAVINIYLALRLSSDQWDEVERTRMPTVKKWRSAPIQFCSDYNFPLGSDLDQDLCQLFECRNSIVHARPDLYEGNEKQRSGNSEDWLKMDTLADRVFDLSLRLLRNLEQFDYWGAVFISAGMAPYLGLRPLPPAKEQPRAPLKK